MGSVFIHLSMTRINACLYVLLYLLGREGTRCFSSEVGISNEEEMEGKRGSGVSQERGEKCCCKSSTPVFYFPFSFMSSPSQPMAFREAMLALWKEWIQSYSLLTSTAAPDNTVACSVDCGNWLKQEDWWCCEEHMRLHECGWYRCQAKIFQNRIYECGLTGYTIQPPDMHTLHHGLLDTATPTLPIADILALNRRTPEFENSVALMVRSTDTWIRSQAARHAGRPSTALLLPAPPQVKKPKIEVRPSKHVLMIEEMQKAIVTPSPGLVLFTPAHFMRTERSPLFFEHWVVGSHSKRTKTRTTKMLPSTMSIVLLEEAKTTASAGEGV